MVRDIVLRIRRWLPWVIGVGLVVAASLVLFVRYLDNRDIAKWRRGAKFVELHGRQIRYDYAPGPSEAPLVVLIPGWAAGSDLGKPLQGHVGAPTLCYDACGVALSDGRPHGCGAEEYADELNELLSKVAPQKKIVVIGYSLSSIAARVFVERHPANVAGLVLLDPNMPEYVDTHPEDRRFYEQLYGRFALRVFVKSLFGVSRLERLAHHVHPTDDVAARVADIDVNAKHWYTVWSTRATSLAAKSQVLTPGHLRDLPLLAVGANMQKDPSFRETLMRILAQSSRSALFEVDGDHSHLLDDSKVGPQVLERIREFVAQIR